MLEARPAAPLATTNGKGRLTARLTERLEVRKTYKLYIGGQFPRTESGRAYEVFDARGRLLANACRATRKDIRDAVRAARRAVPDWAGKTAFNRSQILYRIAELMEGRRDQFVTEVMAAEGVGRRRATRLVDAAIDRWVWYAGWADKFSQVIGSVNPVNGNYFNFSVPEPTSGWSAAWRQSLCRATRPSSSARSHGRFPRSRSRKCSPLRICPTGS